MRLLVHVCLLQYILNYAKVWEANSLTKLYIEKMTSSFGLTDVYDLVINFLLLPSTKQHLAQECHEKQIDEGLDRSLRLVNVCSTTKDAFLHIKEDTQEVAEYLSSRKKENKVIPKSWKDLKSKCTFSSGDNKTTITISVLTEVEAVTFTPSSWPVISKLTLSKRVSCEDIVAETNEFEIVDAALSSLIGHKTRKSSSISADNALSVLGHLELSIQDQGVLECLLRHLIKTRASLLNIINH
ncbi:hypothetical protein ACOSQ4_006024 [Xanthoceras sorbifolium]